MFQKPPTQCPVCGQAGRFVFVRDYQSKDLPAQAGGRFTLYECFFCEVQFWMPFQNPGPAWYEQFGPYIEKREQPHFNLSPWHLKFFEINPRFEKGMKILDIGCGAGEFLHECQKRGAEVWGVDFSQELTKLAQSVFGLENIFTEPINLFLQRKNLPVFDFVTFFEVIEHVDDPAGLVRQAAGLLKPGGKMFVSTPCRERLLVNFDFRDFPYNHLTRWHPESLGRLLERNSLEVKSINFTAGWYWLADTLARHFRFNLVRKTESFLSLAPSKPAPLFKRLTVSIIHVLAFIKDFFMVYIPIFPLWLVSKILGIRNGDMLIEAVKK